MNLNCPYCGESIPYDLSLAGGSVACSYCEHAVRMPLVEELPDELREELRREELKRHEGQKRQYRRKQERFLKEMDREEHQKRKQEARQKQQALEKKAEAARRPVPEELAVRNRYRALRASIAWNRVLAGLVLVGYVVYVLMRVVSGFRGLTSWPWVMTESLLVGIPTALSVLMIRLSGEMIQIFLDVADDVRITRLLTRRQVYGEGDSDSE